MTGSSISIALNVQLDLAFIERSATATAILRQDGLLVFQNRAAARLFAPEQGEPSTIVGENIARWGPPGYAQERIELLNSLAASERDAVVRDLWQGEQIITHLRLLPRLPNESLRHFLTVHERTHGPIDPTIYSEQVYYEPRVQDLGLLAHVSPRELEVLALVGEGLTAAQIGARLHRSIDTINAHRAALLRKLNCQNATQLSVIAHRAGLKYKPVDPD